MLDETIFVSMEINYKQEDLKSLLRKCSHILLGDMGRCQVDLEVAYHILDVNPNVKPFMQKTRRIIQIDMLKYWPRWILLAVIFIKDAKYPKWLSNIVAVPRKNDKCV